MLKKTFSVTESSNLGSIRMSTDVVDNWTGILVGFRNGGIYMYILPKELNNYERYLADFESLAFADSPGRYLNTLLKPHYHCFRQMADNLWKCVKSLDEEEFQTNGLFEFNEDGDFRMLEI